MIKPDFQLVCVGFAKSGTTLINQQLKGISQFLRPQAKKELNYFRESQGNFDDYLTHFDCEKPNFPPEQLSTFEASPVYATGPTLEEFDVYLKRITDCCPNPHILFCLRHPVYRAFSHYVHNLQPFSVWGHNRWQGHENPGDLLKNLYSSDFRSALIDTRNVGVRYADKVSHTLEKLGPQRVHFFCLETDPRDLPAFFNTLASDMGLPLVKPPHTPPPGEGKVPWALRGSPIPTYTTGSEAQKMGVKEALDDDFFALSKVSNLHLKGVSGAAARKMKEAELQWTTHLSAQECRAIFEEFFKRDIAALCDSLSAHSINDDWVERYLNWDYSDIDIPRHPTETTSQAISALLNS